MRVKRQGKKISDNRECTRDKRGRTTREKKEKRYSDDMMDKRPGTESVWMRGDGRETREKRLV
jgi:hypothetical protein